MRILIILFLISILPIQEIKANISIDSIKSAEEIEAKFGRSNISTSIDYYKDIISNSSDTNKLLKSFCFLQMGTLHYYSRKIQKAEFYLNKANLLALNSSNKDLNIQSRVNKLSADLNYLKGNYKNVISISDLAILAQDSLSKPDSLLLCDLYYLIASSHSMLENHQKAISYSQKSLSYLNTLPNIQNWRKANNLKIIGSSYARFKYFNLALKYYYEALNFYNPNRPSVILASTYYYIGSINKTLGDYNLAKTNYINAIGIYDNLFGGKHSNYSYYFNSLASTYAYLGETDSAFLYYNKSIEYSKEYNIKTICVKYHNLAQLYFDNNNYIDAEKYLDKALISVNASFDETSIYRGQIYRFAAKFYIELNKLEKGYEFLKIAFQNSRFKQKERATYLAYCYKILSTYYLKKGEFINAMTACQNALISISRQFKNSDLLSNPSHLDAISKRDLYFYLLWKANITNNSFNNNEVDTLYKLQIQKNALIAAVDVSNSMRLSLLSNEGKYWLAANNKEVYHLLIKNAIELYSFTNNKEHLATAIEASKKSKSGILQDLIKEAKTKELNLLPDSIIVREKQLIHNKSSIEFEIHKTVNSDENSIVIDSLKNELFRAKQQIEAFKTFVNQNFKSFNQAIFKLDNLSINSLQKKINEDQIILEYYLFEKNLYTIMISKTEIQVKEIKIDDSFYDNIDLFCNYIRSPELSTTQEQQNLFKESSYQLYLKLIKPFKELLEDKQLIIIPDDVLLNLPFEVLISDLNDSNTSSPQYLIKSNPIHYSYSSAFLTQNSLRNEFKRDSVLAFIPSYKYDDFKNTSKLKRLPALKHTIAEVEKIGEYYPTKIFNAEDASIENFKKEVKQFSIIHLAMHSEIENDNPGFSKLVFSPNPSKEFNLYTNEIYNLDLNTNLIILSACNTGSGKINKGEGIMSFARAFLYAGCPSLTLTLWTINDKTSSVLMGNFYKYLSKGLNKSKALQLAKLEYLKNADPLKSHPYFWAAYIQIGEDSPITSLNKSQTLIYIFSLLIFGSIIIVLRRQIKGRIKKGE